MTRRLARTAAVLALFLAAGCCGPPPEPLPLQQLYVPPDLRIRLEALRTDLRLYSVQTLLGDALAYWEFREEERHGTLTDDCAHGPDSGEWIEHFCEGRACGHLGERACESRFHPPCEAGLVFVPKHPGTPYGDCRAPADAGSDVSPLPGDR